MHVSYLNSRLLRRHILHNIIYYNIAYIEISSSRVYTITRCCFVIECESEEKLHRVKIIYQLPQEREKGGERIQRKKPYTPRVYTSIISRPEYSSVPWAPATTSRHFRSRAPRVNDDDNPFFTESDKNHPGNSPKANEGTRTITPPAPAVRHAEKLLKMNSPL